jgi:hypothetical protein
MKFPSVEELKHGVFSLHMLISIIDDVSSRFLW